MAEVIPASRIKRDSYSNDDNIDDDSMGNDSDASSENSGETTEGADEQEVPHPPPEVVEEIFSTMIESMPRTKEEEMDC